LETEIFPPNFGRQNLFFPPKTNFRQTFFREILFILREIDLQGILKGVEKIYKRFLKGFKIFTRDF